MDIKKMAGFIATLILISSSAFANQTQFSCNMTSTDNLKDQELDQKSHTYTLGENAGWGTILDVGKPGQSVGFEITLSDNSNRLFITAVSGQVIQNGFAAQGLSSRAIAGLPLAQNLHLDMIQNGIELDVDCTPVGSND